MAVGGKAHYALFPLSPFSSRSSWVRTLGTRQPWLMKRKLSDCHLSWLKDLLCSSHLQEAPDNKTKDRGYGISPARGGESCFLCSCGLCQDGDHLHASVFPSLECV